MEIRQLKTFLVVAETGSVTRAAQMLRIAQPALSRQIRMLEEEHGTALFTRHARGMTLSQAGAILVDHYRRVLRELDSAKSEVAALAGEVTGKIAIGMLPSVSDLLAGRIAAAMKERYPLVRLRILTGLATHLMEWLDKQEIDLAIVSEPVVPASVEFQRLVEEPLYLVGQAATAGFHGQSIPLRQLAQYPLILPSSDFGLRGGIDHAIHAVGIELNVAIEANSLHVQRKLIRAGIGYALFPSSVVVGPEAAPDLAYARIVDPPIVRRIGLAVSNLRHRPFVNRCVAELTIDEMAKSMARGDWPEGRSLLQASSSLG